MKAKYLVLPVLSIILFSSCYPKENIIEKNISGMWILEEVNGFDALTNNRSVCIFAGNKQTFAMGYTLGTDNAKWMESLMAFDVTGHKVILQGTDIVGTTWDLQLNVKSIDEDEFLYTVDKKIVNGESQKDKDTYLYEKPDENYESSIIGLWEGYNVTPGINTTDAPLRRWEYFTDGTYKYYTYTEDENGQKTWTAKEDNNGTYKVYGDLLTCNWSNDEISGVEGTMFECWEIEIEGDGMEWDALREGGSMVYFSMKRVKEKFND